MALRVKIIATDTLSGTLLRVGKSVARLGIRFAKMGVLAAAAISVIAIKLQKDMDRGIREIGTLMGSLTNVEIKNMTRELENLASISGQAMDKLTKAKYDIVSAGFNKAADSAILLNESAILAVGGVTEVSTAADLLTTALNAYNLSAKYAREVSDKLFTVVRLGKTTMNLLGGSMGRLLAITGQFDISLDEVGAALAVLTASGQKTEEAVTAIRASIIELIKPQTLLKNLIAKTDYVTADALIAQEGYAGALSVIKKKADELNIPMKDLFSNVRSMQAVLPLTGLAAKKFAISIDEMKNSAGASAAAYEEMQKSFEIVTNRLKQNVANMLRSLGRELIAKLQPKIEAFNLAMEGMGELDWKKLGSLIFDNWTTILFAMAKIAAAIGEIIAIKLIDKIIEIIRNKRPAILKEFEKIGTLLGKAGDILIDAINWAAGITPEEEEKLFGTKATDSAARIDELTESIKTLTSEGLEKLKTAFKSTKEVISEVIDYSKYAFESIGRGAEEAAEKTKMSWEKFYDWYESEAGQKFIDTARQITNAIGAIYDNFLGLRRAQIQSELDTQIKAVLASGLAEEEKQAKISNLREAARQKEIAAAKAMKPIQIAQAISNTALAVVKALASTVPPWNFVLATLVGAAGAAEVATIAAQPYAHGGFVRGNIPASDTIPAMLTPHEIVSTAAASERFGAEITRLNQLAEGGFGASGGNTFIIQAMDSQSFLEAVKRQPRKFAEAIQLVKSERYL